MKVPQQWNFAWKPRLIQQICEELPDIFFFFDRLRAFNVRICRTKAETYTVTNLELTAVFVC